MAGYEADSSSAPLYLQGRGKDAFEQTQQGKTLHRTFPNTSLGREMLEREPGSALGKFLPWQHNWQQEKNECPLL